MGSEDSIEAAATLDSSQVERLAIDTVHSSIGFSVRHMVLSTLRGRFTRFSGEIKYDRSEIAHSSLRILIDAASASTDNDDRDKDLRGSNFFSVKEFPEITFSSRQVKALCKGYVCIGELNLRGVIRQIEIPFEITGRQKDLQGKERIGFDGSFTVDRVDFGMKFNPLLANGGPIIGREIRVDLSVEAIRS